MKRYLLLLAVSCCGPALDVSTSTDALLDGGALVPVERTLPTITPPYRNGHPSLP